MNKNKTLKYITTTLILAIIAAVLVLAIVLFLQNRHKPSEIPADAVGNTSGNIVNQGLFCESDGYVYFSNIYDQRKLYKMTVDGTDLQCIGSVPVEFINVFDDKVYFYQTPKADNQVFGLGGLYGVCYTDINGKSGMNNIDKVAVNSMILYGPNLYYQHYDKNEGLTLYRADIKTEEKTKLSDKRTFLASTYNGQFYSYDMDNNFYLSTVNPANGQVAAVDNSTRAYNVIVENGYLYYMNVDDDYKIYRMNLSNKSQEQIGDCTVDTFNVYGDNIFYQKNSDGETGLYHMLSDGSGARLISSGNFTNINCTSKYTYFYDFLNASVIYRVPTSGGNADVWMP